MRIAKKQCKETNQNYTEVKNETFRTCFMAVKFKKKLEKNMKKMF